MTLAFGGIAILPYVLADMLQPENARKVVLKASVRITVFYLSVSMPLHLRSLSSKSLSEDLLLWLGPLD